MELVWLLDLGLGAWWLFIGLLGLFALLLILYNLRMGRGPSRKG